MDNSRIKQLLEELEIFIGNPNRQSHLETAEKNRPGFRPCLLYQL